MWRDDPQLNRLVEWILATPASAWLVEISASQPLALLAVQTIHVLGICVIVACAWLTGLWLMGASSLPRALGASPRALIAPVYPTLGVMAATGLVLVVRRPDRILLSPAFPIKIGLIALGLAMMVALDRSLTRDAIYWDRTPGRRRSGRALGLAILATWSAVVFAGRWIPFA